MSSPLTFLCITTYEKGQEFMRECKRQGCRVFLLTAEKLRDADWPRESLDDVFYIPAELPIPEIVKAVTYLARDKKIDRIVALDEFDMETASTLREHMRIPGMGLTTMRYFRDKLAMRMQALEHGIRVPDFIPVLNHDDIRYYLDHVSGPWVLKPRSEASAIGIKLIDSPDALWPILDSLGDQQSSFLLEKFIPGDVYHVDSVVSEREVVFSSVSRYGQPPMAVAQKGGIFTIAPVRERSHSRSRARCSSPSLALGDDVPHGHAAGRALDLIDDVRGASSRSARRRASRRRSRRSGLELCERILRRLYRAGLDDEPLRRMPPRGAPSSVARAASRRRPARVLVDDVALRGSFTGAITVTRSSPSRLAAQASSSVGDATVSFAITRMWPSVGSDRLGVRRAEDRVARAGDAVLVRVADDLRDLVEVEDRRRRGTCHSSVSARHGFPSARGRAPTTRPCCRGRRASRRRGRTTRSR